jgi:alpha-beta hydrolase superfamily lysophospholipase
MQKITLKNRKNQNIVGILESPTKDPAGTAILQHGWGDHKNGPTITAVRNGFHQAGWRTFTFDTTNAKGESDGDSKESCQGLHTEDFFDVMAWAGTQPWYARPIAIAGHSMGGYSVARYAELHPEAVDYCVPLGPVVSGTLLVENFKANHPDRVAKAEATHGAWRYEEWLQHDLLPDAGQITCPTLLIVGSEDDICTPEHVGLLYEAIGSTDKTCTQIAGAPHAFTAPEHQEDCARVISEWLNARL